MEILNVRAQEIFGFRAVEGEKQLLLAPRGAEGAKGQGRVKGPAGAGEPGGATTNGPDATTPPLSVKTRGGGGSWGGGVQPWVGGRGGVRAGGWGGGCSYRGSGGGVWPGVRGVSSQG